MVEDTGGCAQQGIEDAFHIEWAESTGGMLSSCLGLALGIELTIIIVLWDLVCGHLRLRSLSPGTVVSLVSECK